MPTITKISPQQRNPKRLNIHLDGRYAFACAANVAKRHNIAVGMELTKEQIDVLMQAQDNQDCMDDALGYLERRLQSRKELFIKLKRKKHPEDRIEATLKELERLGYVNDDRFSLVKAENAVENKKLGRGRAYIDLLKSGIDSTTAKKTVEKVYETADTQKLALQQALKRAKLLKNLDPLVARRRLMGYLVRRGFDLDDIRPALDQALGQSDDAE